jgi:hypothetical protein
MPQTVQELNHYFIALWWEGDARLPDLGPRYSPRAQVDNEKHLLDFLQKVEQIRSTPPRSRDDVLAHRALLGTVARRLAEDALGFSGAQLDGLPSQAFADASEAFVQGARLFDPGLSAEDIFQAGRNAWTAFGLQWLVGLPVELTPSILAYSLLYPYTDNYLDEPSLPALHKRTFNERFRRRLAGESLMSENSHEQIIFELVEMIEQQYPRLEFPRVFESLLAIHDAQAKSLKLLQGTAAPGEVDVLGLSFEKGGTSVLADAELVCDRLSEAQRAYAYGHGIIAQLLDDLEDIELDRDAGRLTLYSQAAGRWHLDGLMTRTLQFGLRVLDGLEDFPIGDPHRELIRRGAGLALLETIGRSSHYFSEPYLRELEAHAPFRFSFLNEQRQAFFARHGSFVHLLETAMRFPS